jgi:hypothetical protein
MDGSLQMGFRQRPSWHPDAVRGAVHPIIPEAALKARIYRLCQQERERLEAVEDRLGSRSSRCGQRPAVVGQAIHSRSRPEQVDPPGARLARSFAPTSRGAEGGGTSDQGGVTVRAAEGDVDCDHVPVGQPAPLADAEAGALPPVGS